MIVNPAPSFKGMWSLGEDWTLYRVAGPGGQQEKGNGGGRVLRRLRRLRRTGRGRRERRRGQERARFFLGADGTVYEVAESR
jgi:hypothetical protein